MSEALVDTVQRHLEALAGRYPDRHPGRSGNSAANDYAESIFAEHGWRVASVGFEVLDHEAGLAALAVDGREIPLHTGPYSLPVEATAPLLTIDTVAALAGAHLEGSIVLLHGDIAAEQLAPSSSDAIDTPEHRHVLELLQAGQPVAIIAATGRGDDRGGGRYPCPLIEDGDFDIPNAYTSDDSGVVLTRSAGRPAHLVIEGRRFSASARQLTATRGPAGAPRAIAIAHIDSKSGSPGAVDNAAGVAALLASARLLEDYGGPYRIELLPMNGRDYYAHTGERLFERANEGRWDEISGAVNIDAIGGRGAGTAASMYSVSGASRDIIHRVVRRHARVTVGERWEGGDHEIVAGHRRPAVALTSALIRELRASVIHTEHDALELVDPAEVAAAADFVADLMRALPAVGGPGA